jgi:Cu/Ag efflux pump CusA
VHLPGHGLLGHRPAQDLAGSLIIALGLLVDDAIIAVEMMVGKMEEGYDKVARHLRVRDHGNAHVDRAR